MDTEANAVADIARRAHSRAVVELTENVQAVRTRDDENWWVFDAGRFESEPRRSQGTIAMNDADSFVHAVNQRRILELPDPVLYADESTLSLTAILNDDHAGLPGWRDYRVEQILLSTPEWDRWIANEGLMPQAKFAGLIEDSVEDISDPSQADMLSLAQSFQADTTGKFKAGANLQNGAKQLVYEETIEAKAGKDGAITIPKTMTLALRPFYGSVVKNAEGAWVPGRFAVEALFRYSISREGVLSIGYKLVAPLEVKRAAYRNMVTQVGEALNLVVLSGPAPKCRNLGDIGTAV